jgi:hypothetical protein
MRSIVATAPHEKPHAARPDDPIRPDDRFIPADIPYRILCGTGRVLGTVGTLQEAMECYNRWSQATAVVLGNSGVCQRTGGEA